MCRWSYQKISLLWLKIPELWVPNIYLFSLCDTENSSLGFCRNVINCKIIGIKRCMRVFKIKEAALISINSVYYGICNIYFSIFNPSFDKRRFINQTSLTTSWYICCYYLIENYFTLSLTTYNSSLNWTYIFKSSICHIHVTLNTTYYPSIIRMVILKSRSYILIIEIIIFTIND